jgi:hypothetical protein
VLARLAAERPTVRQHVTEARVFRYWGLPAAHYLFVLVAGAALLIYAAIAQDASLLVWLVLFVSIVGSVAPAVANPLRIEVGRENVKAWWLGGREKTWLRTDLKIRNPERYRSRLSYLPRLEIVDANGSVAFRVYPQLQNYLEFFDLFAPGVRRLAEERAAKSWWSRNLL